MFAAVEFLSEKRDFRERLREQFFSPEIISERREVPEALPFFTVKIKKHRGEYPLKKAEELMGQLSSCVIYKTKGEVPKGCDFKVFEGDKLKKRLLFNSAVKYIESLKLDPTEQYISVVDIEGLYTEDIKRLAFLASRLHVVTKRRDIYENTALLLMEGYGITLPFSEDFTPTMRESSFIISFDTEIVPVFYKGVLISVKKKRSMMGVSLFCHGIDLPKKYKDIIPEGFDEEELACALYEKCGAEDLGGLTFKAIDS